MIASLTGRCIHVDTESIVVDVNGVGYLVRATTGVIDQARRNPDSVAVHVFTSVREDAIQLYGFASSVEQTVFERLVQLQGVGPKVAIAILSTIAPADIRRATEGEDVALFQTVSGVGPKVAKRIVTELKGKLEDIPVTSGITLGAKVEDAEISHSMVHYEAREALIGLGISLVEAEILLSEADPELTVEERIRFALSAKAAR